MLRSAAAVALGEKAEEGEGSEREARRFGSSKKVSRAGDVARVVVMECPDNGCRTADPNGEAECVACRSVRGGQLNLNPLR